MSPPETPEPSDYRPLMGTPPTEASPLFAPSPDADLPTLRGFLWTVAWVVATVLLVAQYALDA